MAKQKTFGKTSRKTLQAIGQNAKKGRRAQANKHITNGSSVVTSEECVLNKLTAQDLKIVQANKLIKNFEELNENIDPKTSSNFVKMTEVEIEIENIVQESGIEVELDTSLNNFRVNAEDSSTLGEQNMISVDIQGRRIVDFWYFMEQLFTISSHGHTTGCKLKHLKFLIEKPTGLLSKFCVKCTVCGSIFYLKTSKEDDDSNVNSSAVAAVIASGINLPTFNGFFKSMDLPTLPFLLFSQYFEKESEMWKAKNVVKEEIEDRPNSSR